MQESKQPLLNPAQDEEHLIDTGNTISPPLYGSLSNPRSQTDYPPPRYHQAIQSPDDDAQRETAPGSEETKVYKRRWYILIVYSLVTATQGGVWNTFGPISATAEDAFGWSDATIVLLSNWGPISYLLSGVVMSWMLDVKGLRMSCIITAIFVAVGTALRCITFETPAVTWLMHVGHFLNGLGGPVAMAAPPILSAVWFPAKERTTATAIGTVFNYLGVALSFIMGPLLVPDVPSNLTNGSSVHLSGATNKQREERNRALHVHRGRVVGGGVAAVPGVLPQQAPLPPSPSAAIQREDFVRGLKSLFTRGQFWLVAFVYGISLGTLNCWSSVLDVILKPHGIDEHEAGWIGFYATCSACVASLIVARFADFFSRIMKWLVLCSYFLGTASLVVFTLATVRVTPPSTVLFYSTIIGASTCLNAAVPLIFELACELSYPTGEGTTNGVMTIVNNIFGLIFLFIMMIPDIGHAWTNWMVVGTSGVCLPLLFLMKEQYNRLEIDEHNPSLSAEIVFPEPQG